MTAPTDEQNAQQGDQQRRDLANRMARLIRLKASGAEPLTPDFSALTWPMLPRPSSS